MTTPGRELAEFLIATSATLSGLFFVAYQAGRKTKRYLDDWAFVFLFAPFGVGAVGVLSLQIGALLGAAISAAEAAAWWRLRLKGTWNVSVQTMHFAVQVILILAFLFAGLTLTYFALVLPVDVLWRPASRETDFLLFLLFGQLVGSAWAFVMLTYEEAPPPS